MKQIAQIEKSYMKDKVPEFKSGDTVKVHVKIREGDKERVQVFQGTVISRRGGGINETFTVRKVSGGIGVERVFPLHSPNVSKIQRVRKGKVRQAKLYYLRGLTGKSARIEELLEEKDSSAKETGEESAKKKRKKSKKAAAKAEKEVKATAEEAEAVEEEAGSEETTEEEKEEEEEKSE